MTFPRVSVAAYTTEPDHFFVHVSVKFQLKETQENVAETCLFHVSVDVFQATEWVMEPAETQETVLETEVCFMFPLQLTSRKRVNSNLSYPCGNFLALVNLFFPLSFRNAPL